MNVKERTLIAVQNNPGKTAVELAALLGVAQDGVRKALRAHEVAGLVHVSERIWDGMVVIRRWSAGSGQTIRSTVKKRGKDSAEAVARWKANYAEKEAKRLRDNYIKGERVWGI